MPDLLDAPPLELPTQLGPVSQADAFNDGRPGYAPLERTPVAAPVAAEPEPLPAFSADELPDAIDAIKALKAPSAKKSQMLDAVLTSAFQDLNSSGGIGPNEQAKWTKIAEAARAKIEPSFGGWVGEKAKGLVTGTGEMAVGLAKDVGTAAYVIGTGFDATEGFSPEAKAAGEAMGMQTVSSLDAIKSWTARQFGAGKALNKEFDSLKMAIDEGRVPLGNANALHAWMTAKSDQMQPALAQSFADVRTFGFDTPNETQTAFASENSLKRNPAAQQLLMAYITTRNPDLWKQFKAVAAETPERAAMREQRGDILNSEGARNFDALFGEKASEHLISASNPWNLMLMSRIGLGAKAIAGAGPEVTTTTAGGTVTTGGYRAIPAQMGRVAAEVAPLGAVQAMEQNPLASPGDVAKQAVETGIEAGLLSGVLGGATLGVKRAYKALTDPPAPPPATPPPGPGGPPQGTGWANATNPNGPAGRGTGTGTGTGAGTGGPGPQPGPGPTAGTSSGRTGPRTPPGSAGGGQRTAPPPGSGRRSTQPPPGTGQRTGEQAPPRSAAPRARVFSTQAEYNTFMDAAVQAGDVELATEAIKVNADRWNKDWIRSRKGQSDAHGDFINSIFSVRTNAEHAAFRQRQQQAPPAPSSAQTGAGTPPRGGGRPEPAGTAGTPPAGAGSAAGGGVGPKPPEPPPEAPPSEPPPEPPKGPPPAPSTPPAPAGAAPEPPHPQQAKAASDAAAAAQVAQAQGHPDVAANVVKAGQAAAQMPPIPPEPAKPAKAPEPTIDQAKSPYRGIPGFIEETPDAVITHSSEHPKIADGPRYEVKIAKNATDPMESLTTTKSLEDAFAQLNSSEHGGYVVDNVTDEILQFKLKPEGEGPTIGKAKPVSETEPPLPSKAHQDSITRLMAAQVIIEGKVDKKKFENAWQTIKTHAARLGIEVGKIGTFFHADEYRQLARDAVVEIGKKFGSHPTPEMRRKRDEANMSPKTRELWSDLTRFFTLDVGDTTRKNAIDSLKTGKLSQQDADYLISRLENPNYRGNAKQIAPTLVARIKDFMGGTSPPAPAPAAPAPTEPATPKPTTHLGGDLAEYTGEVRQLHGGTFYVLTMMEGHKKGQEAVTSHPPKALPKFEDFQRGDVVVWKGGDGSKGIVLTNNPLDKTIRINWTEGRQADEQKAKGRTYGSFDVDFKDLRKAEAPAPAPAPQGPKPVHPEPRDIPPPLAKEEAKPEPAKQKAPIDPTVAKQQKQYLLDEVDDAIKDAPENDQLNRDTQADRDLTELQKARKDRHAALQAENPNRNWGSIGDRLKADSELIADPYVQSLLDRYQVPEGTPAYTGPESLIAGVKVMSDQPAKLYNDGDRIDLLIKKMEAEHQRQLPHVTIDVPGDGTFEIINTKEALQDFKTRAKNFPTTPSKPDVRTTPAGLPKPTAITPLPKKAPPTEDVIKAVTPFTSGDETRFTITYVYSNGKHVVATDGRRLIMVDHNAGGSKETPVFFKDGKKTSKLEATSDKGVKSKAEYPNYMQVVPDTKRQTSLGTVDTGRMIQILTQAKALLKPEDPKRDTGSVALVLNPDKSIGVYGNNPNVGGYEHNIQDDHGKIGNYNVDYLLDIMKSARALGHEQVELRGQDDISPLSIDAKGMRTVLMPMRTEGSPMSGAGSDVESGWTKIGKILKGEKPAAEKPQAKKPKAEKKPDRIALLENYFTPGKIVKSYGGWDKVIAFHNESGMGAGWRVDVIAVNKDGSPIKDERVRSHATEPNKKELQAAWDNRPAETPQVEPVSEATVNEAIKLGHPVVAADLDKYGIALPDGYYIGPDNVARRGNDWTRATDGSIPGGDAGNTPPPGEPPGPEETGPPGVPRGFGLQIKAPQLRKFRPLDKATAAWSYKLQLSNQDARRAVKDITKAAPTVPERNAITIYREAGGNMGLLGSWATTPLPPAIAAAGGKPLKKWYDAFQKAARDAMNLSPEHLGIAGRVADTFDVLHDRGNIAGVIEAFRDNYVPHIWDLGKGTGGGSRRLQKQFRFAKARTLDTIFDGLQAGMIPKSLDIASLLPAYMVEMDSVIAARQFVQDAYGKFAADDRPLMIPTGNVKVIEGAHGDRAYLVSPRSWNNGPRDRNGNEFDQRDYKVMPGQPALEKWLWRGEDADGNPIFLNSELKLHPDAFKRIRAMIGGSEIRAWYESPSSDYAMPVGKFIAKALDKTQAAMKREMFSLYAPFHQVQEGTHAIGHTVNPFFGLMDTDLRDPGPADAVLHGLMLEPDRASMANYLNGVGARSTWMTSLLKAMHIPGLPAKGPASWLDIAKRLGEGAEAYQDYLFHSYIPRLKYTTYEHILTRARKDFARQLTSGEVSEEDLKLMSAMFANAAFGHQNYAMMDRSPTVQHFLQIIGLAPDFFEARLRFAGQAVKGVAAEAMRGTSGYKGPVGREQFRAIAILGLAMAGIAFTLAQVFDGQWDAKDPFAVKFGNRRYSLRSVPEDSRVLATETYDLLANRGTGGVPFVSARVNPLGQSIMQAATSTNWRGEKVTIQETAEELVGKFLPLTLRPIPGLRDLNGSNRNYPVSPLQQLAGSLGLKINRYSPIGDTYKLANKWKSANGIESDFKGAYPVSKYQQLRYAIEDGDLERAAGEYKRLLKEQKPGRDSAGNVITPTEMLRSGFKKSVSHLFTGSKENEEKFVKSLNEDDKAIYRAAVDRRRMIIDTLPKVKQQLLTPLLNRAERLP